MVWELLSGGATMPGRGHDDKFLFEHDSKNTLHEAPPKESVIMNRQWDEYRKNECDVVYG